MVLELRLICVLKYWSGKSIELVSYKDFLKRNKLSYSLLLLLEMQIKSGMKIGIQIQSLLTPTPCFGKCEPSSEEHEAPWKKRLDSFLTKCVLLSCRNTSYLLWCSGFIIWKLCSTHLYKYMDIFMYRSISFNQFTYCTLWQLKRKPVKYRACKMFNIVPRLCGDYLN